MVQSTCQIRLLDVGTTMCLSTWWEVVHNLVAVLGRKYCMKNVDLSIIALSFKISATSF